MSYYTRVELKWDDSDYAAGSLISDDIIPIATSFACEQGWGNGVIDDLRVATSERGLDHPGFNKLCAPELVALMMKISASFPSVTFFARGVGEEIYDIWAVRLREGEIVWGIGPFEGEEATMRR